MLEWLVKMLHFLTFVVSFLLALAAQEVEGPHLVVLQMEVEVIVAVAVVEEAVQSLELLLEMELQAATVMYAL
jgi:hypothetical protein